MRLFRDHSAGAYAVDVQCYRCNGMVRLAGTVIDSDGPPFAAYYCDGSEHSARYVRGVLVHRDCAERTFGRENVDKATCNRRDCARSN